MQVTDQKQIHIFVKKRYSWNLTRKNHRSFGRPSMSAATRKTHQTAKSVCSWDTHLFARKSGRRHRGQPDLACAPVAALSRDLTRVRGSRHVGGCSIFPDRMRGTNEGGQSQHVLPNHRVIQLPQCWLRHRLTSRGGQNPIALFLVI